MQDGRVVFKEFAIVDAIIDSGSWCNGAQLYAAICLAFTVDNLANGHADACRLGRFDFGG